MVLVPFVLMRQCRIGVVIAAATVIGIAPIRRVAIVLGADDDFRRATAVSLRERARQAECHG
jgi:hypothetical protein